MRVRVLATLSIAAALAVASAFAQSAPATMPIVLARAAFYVDDFLDEFSNVVAEESYRQDSSTPLQSIIPTGRGASLMNAMIMGQIRHRELKSDFLLVKVLNGLDWVPFRDVFEVDGVPVRDREQRLTKLFIQPSADGVAQADRIRNESARYNLGSMLRTVNNPILPLIVLEPEIQPRFRFTPGKRDASAGPGVFVVDFKEEGRPTIIVGRAGMDLFSSGTFWIEAETGRLLKADMTVDQPGLRARVVTTFKPDDRFKSAVPVLMEEHYVMDGGTRLNAVATYGRFRRFDVNAEQEIHDKDLLKDAGQNPVKDPVKDVNK